MTDVDGAELLLKLEPLSENRKLKIPLEIGWIGHTGRFDDQNIRFYFRNEFIQPLDKVRFDANAENRSTADFHHIDLFAFNECTVDTDFAKFIHQNRQFPVLRKTID